MGEHQTAEIAELLNLGVSVHDIKSVRGTVYKEGDCSQLPPDAVIVDDYDAVSGDKVAYARATAAQYAEQARSEG